MNDEPESVVPYNIEAEQVLIGSILMDNEVMARVANIVEADQFYEPTHGRIFAIAQDMIDADKLVTPITMRQALIDDGGLKQLGGPGYLVRCAGAATPSHSLHYATIVNETWRRRSIIDAARRAGDLAASSAPASEALKVMDAAVAEIPGSDRPATISALGATIEALRMIKEAIDGVTPGVPYGIRDLDERMGGMFPSNYIVLAGRPSMGKTALALGIVMAQAKAGKKIVIWSREMTPAELVERLISAECKVPYADIRRGSHLNEMGERVPLTDQQREAIVEATKLIGQLPIQIVPEHIVDVPGAHAAIRQARHILGGLDFVVMDYLQLVKSKGNSRTEEVANSSADLKSMAKALGVPVLTLSQLSRNVENRDDKRPMLSDLRDSGTIEQDADVVLFVYRHEYYLQRQTPPEDFDKRADYEADLLRWRNKMEVICAKQRMGDIGSDTIGAHMATNRFWSYKPTPATFGDDEERTGGF